MKIIPVTLLAVLIGLASIQGSLAAPPVLAQGPGGITVTGEEVLAEAAQRLPIDVRDKALADPRNITTLTNDIAIRRALAAEAEKVQLDKDPAVALQLRLARDRVLAEARLAKAEGGPADRPALEKAALAEYRAQPERFAFPEQVRVRHVLIDARSCEAERRATEVLAQARAPGADFAALAREYSQDPGSAKRGGDLGFFERGRMAPEFEKAAFALANPGDLSDVVRTSFGFHIIRLEERKPAGREPFEKVRDALVQDLVNRENRNRRRVATEAIAGSIQLDQDAIDAFAKQAR
jgi:peptidyl-prolyl cis-trans isomerase C